MGREQFSKPLPGDQHRTIASMAVGGQAGPSNQHFRTTTSGGAVTQQGDGLELSTDGVDGSTAIADLPLLPSTASSGRFIGQALVTVPAAATASTVRYGFAATEQAVTGFSNAAYVVVDDPAAIEVVDGGALDGASVGISVTERTLVSIAVDYDDDLAFFGFNRNPYVGETSIEFDGGVPSNLSTWFCGIESNGGDSGESVTLHYAAVRFIP